MFFVSNQKICVWRKKEQRSSYWNVNVLQHKSSDSGHEVIKIEIEIPTVAKPRAVVVCKAREEHAETSELAR
jgi:hypothetical protein